MSSVVKEKSNLPWVLGWAVYLACSWTWCIGMFLPVLLVRDYGIYGWVVFAIPNIVGAIAMAYILKKPAQSKELVSRHKIACTIFSVVSILFQIFFIGWISMFIPKGLFVGSLIALLLIYCFLSSSSKKQIISALFVWILSITAFVWIVKLAPINEIGYSTGILTHFNSGLLYLAPVCTFGFLLCPYLDLTFHKALQSNTSKDSKIAFALGFGFMFLLMILFTLMYAKPLASIIAGIPFVLKDQSLLSIIYMYIIACHIILQAGFTTILHLRSIESIFKQIKIPFFILGTIIFLIPLVLKSSFTFLGISANEVLYRVFMGFYGLIAPSYVFLCIFSKSKISFWILAVLLALPFFTLGFLGIKWNLTIWLFPGLAIILFSRLFTLKGKEH